MQHFYITKIRDAVGTGDVTSNRYGFLILTFLLCLIKKTVTQKGSSRNFDSNDLGLLKWLFLILFIPKTVFGGYIDFSSPIFSRNGFQLNTTAKNQNIYSR